jgi:hypothetical protein
MTPKHRERIKNLIAALEDYEHNTEFAHNDFDIPEYNAIHLLTRRLSLRLKEPDDD